MTNGLRLYTPDEARTEYFKEKVSRHNIYEAIKTGELEHIRMGRRILLSEQALAAWIVRLTKKAAV